ncbi:hypothetical protein M8494_24060 [Serratia ureilytica]
MKPAGVSTPFVWWWSPTSNRRDAGRQPPPVRPFSRSQDGTLQSPQDPLHILYQDEHIMVVNKPSGLLSVPGRAPETKTA